MNILLATENRGKVAELEQLLPPTIEILTLRDVGLSSPVEDGSTFVENARIKAVHGSSSGFMSVADDSGLCVDALDGRPGIYSSRFAHDSASDDENNLHLLRCLSKNDNLTRAARFVSAVVLVDTKGNTYEARATLEGVIIDHPRGNQGFGYDPLFEICDPEATAFKGMTLAELTVDEKNLVSHRARAYRKLVQKLARASMSNAQLSIFCVEESGEIRR